MIKRTFITTYNDAPYEKRHHGENKGQYQAQKLLRAWGHRSRGGNMLATVKKKGEVILNERHQLMLGGDATFRKMGVPGFENSGITDFGLTAQVGARFATNATPQKVVDDMLNVILKMPRKVLVLQDFESHKAQRTHRRTRP